MRPLMTLCCAGLAFGCSGGGTSRGPDPTPDPSFTMATSSLVPVAIEVLDRDGAPLRAVAVSIEDPAVASGAETPGVHRTHHRGLTRADGRLLTQIRLPLDREQVDVVVNVAGQRGPFSDTGLRAALGPTAPSARLTVAPEALAAVRIVLEPRD